MHFVVIWGDSVSDFRLAFIILLGFNFCFYRSNLGNLSLFIVFVSIGRCFNI